MRQTVQHLQEEVERLRLKIPVASSTPVVTGTATAAVTAAGAPPPPPSRPISIATTVSGGTGASAASQAAVVTSTVAAAEGTAPPDTDAEDDDDDGAQSVRSNQPIVEAHADGVPATAAANMWTHRGAAELAEDVLAALPVPPLDPHLLSPSSPSLVAPGSEKADPSGEASSKEGKKPDLEEAEIIEDEKK